MTIETELEEIDLINDLGTDDLLVINKAKTLLASCPILSKMDETNETKVWYSDNIECQSKLENIKSRVDTLKWQKYYAACEKEGSLLRDDYDSYKEYRSREDRVSVMLYDDNTLKDFKLTEKRLESISSYIASLIWSLRNLTQIFTMRH